jgi:phosphatidylglycerol:prolipoprotein diacylglycerol transferase
MRYPGALIALAIALPLVGPWLGRGIPLRLWGDLLVPGAGFALVMIRIDCFLAGCCAGRITQLPWGVSFPAGSKPWYTQVLAGLISTGTPEALPIHPLQLYFLLLALGVGLLALWWLPRKAYDGQVVLLFLAVHELGKFALEFLREPPLPQVQIASGAIGLAAAVALVAIHLRGRELSRLEAA